MQYAVVLVLTFCVAGSVAVATDLQDCRDAFDAEDWGAAIAICTKVAEQGNADAQLYVGFLYLGSLGVPQDYVKSIEWHTKAAEQGNADAQNNLGMMYYNGLGAPQDYAEAVEWYTKAAQQGHALAQSSLGLIYSSGSVPYDYAKAFEWYTKAAQQGRADAQYYLAFMYQQGQGVQKSEKMAYHWYTLSATLDSDPDSSRENVYILDSLAKQMTAQDISEALRMSAEWLEKFQARQKSD